MLKYQTNPLVAWSTGLLAGYWAFGLLLPGPWLSAFVSACLLVIGSMVVCTAAPEALRIIRKGLVGPGELAVIGIFVLALGSFYSGSFGILWNIAGNPSSWTGTAYSSFGRAMMFVGFGLVLLSPDASREGIKPPRWYVVVLACALIAVLAFFVGVQFGEVRLPKTGLL